MVYVSKGLYATDHERSSLNAPALAEIRCRLNINKDQIKSVIQNNKLSEALQSHADALLAENSGGYFGLGTDFLLISSILRGEAPRGSGYQEMHDAKERFSAVLQLAGYDDEFVVAIAKAVEKAVEQRKEAVEARLVERKAALRNNRR